jgi:hypothetical protein
LLVKEKRIHFYLAIVWVYNLVWFVPLDFTKFGLQVAFNRSLHVVKPFEHIHRRLIASKQAKGTVIPIEMIAKIVGNRREQIRRLSEREEPKQASWFTATLDEAAQTGSSYYSPYTETLSVLTQRNPLRKSL